MRPKVENPAWWGLYIVWIGIERFAGTGAPFRTLLSASILAGVMHASIQSLFFERYKKNNPWHAKGMTGTRAKYVVQWFVTALVA